MEKQHTVDIKDFEDQVSCKILARSTGYGTDKHLIVESYLFLRLVEFVVKNKGSEVYRGARLKDAIEIYNDLP